jgi:hypothetical protein
MPSANDFATRALQSIGVAGAIDTISSEDAALALNVLNEWIDQLGIQRNTIYTVKRQTHTLASGTSSYTIGSGGTINVARPIWIENVGLILDTGSSPPGYERAIRSNLAVELAPFYGIPVSPDLRDQASTSMLRIKRANVRIREVPIDPSLTRRSRTMTNSQFRGGLF